MHRVKLGGVAKAVMPPVLFSRPMAIRAGLTLLVLLAPAWSASSSDPVVVIQSQPQTEVTAPKPPGAHKPVLQLPAKRSELSVDRELSRTLTKRLHRDRLPYVKAQVLIDAPSKAKSVVLTGQVRADFSKHDAEETVRNFFKSSTVAIENQIKVNPEIGSAPPPITAHQNELEIPQVGFISRRFLGCWSGITAGTPTTWQTLSEAGSHLGYHADSLGLCLTWRDGKLEVTDASAYDSDPGAEMYGFSYKPVSASGTEIKLELKSWDMTDAKGYVATGTARCTLNPDDTVADFISVTTFLNGQAAVKSETTAHLQREHRHDR